MRLSRFERKIIAAMAVVAIGPFLATLFFGRVALRDAYHVGVRPEFEEQLQHGVDAYRQLLLQLRQTADRTADAVVGSATLRDALAAHDGPATERVLADALTRYADLAEIRIFDASGRLVAQAASPAHALGDDVRQLTLRRPIPGLAGRRAELVVVAPNAPFEAFQRAGEIADVYSRLQTHAAYVASVYLWAYVAVLLVVIALALFAGIVASRRVTRRVSDLVAATRRVGTGDLTVHVHTTGTDEIRELTESFNAMVLDLRESSARIEYLQRIGAWQDFARRLAHEIKNPLTPIQLAAQEVSRSYEGPDDAFGRKLRDACAIIEEEVASLRQLVGEFSDFAKLPRADLAPADLNELLEDFDRIRGFLEGDEARANQLELVFEPAPEPLPVRVDLLVLRRALGNLVRNAAQAASPGLRLDGRPEGLRSPDGADADRPQGRVVVRACRQGSQAVLQVDDNGPGVPAEDRDHIFDPYYTTKTDGTGLGLAIVKKSVLEHGGTVSCEVSPLGGARFTIRLPLDEG